MNILFAGTPDPSARILDYLIADSSINVIGVLTQPDKPQKRGKIVAESPVSNIAYHNKIKTFKPNDLNDKHLVSEISALDIDILLVAAYGKILPKWLLLLSNIFPVNIHYSLLPKYRGASPIQTSLLNDDEITGVTFMKMSEGLDEGNIITRFPLKIEHKHNKILLENDLCSLAINNLSDVISLIKSDKLDLERQDDSLASFCSKIDKADSLVDFHSSASDIFNKHRAYYEWPGTAFIYNNIRIKIGEMSVCDIDSSDNPGKILKFDTTGLYVNTNTKAIVITYLQFPGKKMISCSDAFNAYRNFFE